MMFIYHLIKLVLFDNYHCVLFLILIKSRNKLLYLRFPFMHPGVVLGVPFNVVQHPVAERLERRRRKTTPYLRQCTVVYRLGQILEFAAHANFARQSSTKCRQRLAHSLRQMVESLQFLVDTGIKLKGKGKRTLICISPHRTNP